MKRLAIALLLSTFAAVPVYAQTCKAVSADGKPLQGAAKTSYMKKCCEDNAKSADGKALAGAARTSYVNKCMKG
jgi:cytochrome c oxidase assembly protein Cox11